VNPADLPFDADAMLDGLRAWIECESPTYDAASVNRMMDIASRDLVSGCPAAWASATACAPPFRTLRQMCRGFW
jgi:hypothetical protein